MLEFLAVVVLILLGLAALIYIINNTHTLMTVLKGIFVFVGICVALAIAMWHEGWEFLPLFVFSYLLIGGISVCLDDAGLTKELNWQRIYLIMAFSAFMIVALIIKMNSSDG